MSTKLNLQQVGTNLSTAISSTNAANTKPEDADGSPENSPGSKKKKKETFLYLCTTKCRYVVVKKALRQLGYKMLDDEAGDWDIYWNDTNGTTPEQVAKLMPH